MEWFSGALAALGLALVALAVLWLVIGIRFYLRFRGKRLVVCPETKKPAAVEVAAAAGAVTACNEPIELHLKSCSRWPERQDCGQYCLSQIEAAPEDCLVWNMVTRWYEGKRCAYCRQLFRKIDWHEHRPALVGDEGKTVQWTDVAAQKLPDVLSTHQPVCWNCHIAETLLREHPGLVTDRIGARRRLIHRSQGSYVEIMVHRRRLCHIRS